MPFGDHALCKDNFVTGNGQLLMVIANIKTFALLLFALLALSGMPLNTVAGVPDMLFSQLYVTQVFSFRFLHLPK